MKNAIAKQAQKLALVSAPVILLGSSAFAADTLDFTQMTADVNFTSVIAAVMAVGGILVGPLVAKKGVKFLLGLIGR